MDAGDQLEGESFQPAYAPYVPPPQAYDGAYEPLEQRGIEAAVAAGAAGYNGVSVFLVFFGWGVGVGDEGASRILFFGGQCHSFWIFISYTGTIWRSMRSRFTYNSSLGVCLWFVGWMWA